MQVAAETLAGSILAPAKINLTLEIFSRRDDGLHALRSVMLPVALYDAIRWTPSARFAFRSTDEALVRDNLVVDAFRALGLHDLPIEIELAKAIPIGAGLGGGSSDAAAIVLAAMDGAFGPAGERDWVGLTRRLGSDVSFFLARTGALVEGAGERVTPIGALPAWWAVIFRPACAVNTAHAYRLYDEKVPSPPSRPRAASVSLSVVNALQRSDFPGVLTLLSNDFHDVIVAEHPPIARACDALLSAGARRPMLSGSGSALFALAQTESEARAIVAKLALADGEHVFAVPFHRDTRWRA